MAKLNLTYIIRMTTLFLFNSGLYLFVHSAPFQIVADKRKH